MKMSYIWMGQIRQDGDPVSGFMGGQNALGDAYPLPDRHAVRVRELNGRHEQCGIPARLIGGVLHGKRNYLVTALSEHPRHLEDISFTSATHAPEFVDLHYFHLLTFFPAALY